MDEQVEVSQEAEYDRITFEIQIYEKCQKYKEMNRNVVEVLKNQKALYENNKDRKKKLIELFSVSNKFLVSNILSTIHSMDSLGSIKEGDENLELSIKEFKNIKKNELKIISDEIITNIKNLIQFEEDKLTYFFLLKMEADYKRKIAFGYYEKDSQDRNDLCEDIEKIYEEAKKIAENLLGERRYNYEYLSLILNKCVFHYEMGEANITKAYDLAKMTIASIKKEKERFDLKEKDFIRNNESILNLLNENLDLWCFDKDEKLES